ncbi:MAG: hypothetical protein JNM63_16095, partial [Spirochaetia bacterium]|nr:hypothetical protein [Spirochaetia bacterium]
MAKLKYAYDKIKRKVFTDFWKIKKPEDFFSGKMTDLQFFLGLFSLPEKGHAVIQAMLAHWMEKGVLESKDGLYHFPGETPALSLREVFPKPKVEAPTEENPGSAIGETLDLLDTLHLVHHHRDRARLSVGEDTLLFTKEFKDFVGRMRYLNPVPDGGSSAGLNQAEKKLLARIYESL